MQRLKGEQRARRRRKARHAPRGGTRGGQHAHLAARKGYAGYAKRLAKIQRRRDA